MVTSPADDVTLIGRRTAQRATVLAALIQAGGFVGARALHASLQRDGSHIGLSTVYRTLGALADAGRADVVRDRGGERLYRHRPSAEHRHYLLCRACGMSMPIDSAAVETWAEHIARSSGFAEVEHTVELTGLCPDCRPH
ncbi:Fur family transcriptional regulator [Streptomyces violascens]|uniref:Transcriptional repressor n=1 Tax=Streptomyces violascens TaxID=67381 RepID=A0ABQ3QSJ7_9ACTN|nr:transcriptional repressor [Streptomyces violascens]GHI40250.1 transcriptional repressor [Streptomyces violascens]